VGCFGLGGVGAVVVVAEEEEKEGAGVVVGRWCRT
jgi:hypothetical protein